MNKTILIFVMLMFSQIIYAKPIDVSTAKTVAVNFMNYKQPEKDIVINMIFEEKVGSEILFYVFTFKDCGWIAVSGDDTVTPILGYSFSTVINDFNDKPPVIVSWFDNYKEQIKLAKQVNKTNDEILKKWTDILENKFLRLKRFSYTAGDVLLDTPRGEVNWAQSTNNDGGCTPSYNKFCPPCDKCNCDHYTAGCGAVAMAEIMWYYKWPNRAYIPMAEYGMSLPYSYDWQLMPAEVDNSTDVTAADEVAKLIRHCGRANYMNYWKQGSWTTTDHIVDAFKNSFSYKSVKAIERKYYDDNTWRDILRTEIEEGRPVIYRGGKVLWEGDVHYFVLDGYDAADPDFFHFNFGWRGNWNDFFYINDLTPNDHDYNDKQQAIIGIAPTCNTINENITSLSYQTVENNSFGHEQAKNNIVLPANGSGLTVKDGGKLILTAGNSIRLEAGFKVEAGAEFRAQIDPICDDCRGDIQVSQWNNFISPNGDGFNDELCYDVTNVGSYVFQVFDVNGIEEIFSSSGRVTGNTVCVWDGSGACNWCAHPAIVTFFNECGYKVEKAYMISVLWETKKSAKLDTLSINELSNITSGLNVDDNLFKIFPNPSSGKFNIELSGNEQPASIDVYNMAGQKVYCTSISGLNVHSIDLSSKPKGAYLIRINQKNLISTKTLIIK